MAGRLPFEIVLVEDFGGDESWSLLCGIRPAATTSS
jgi:hypothetical protein